MTTTVATTAVTETEPEHGFHPAQARGDQQQDAGQDRPELPRHAVVEGQHLCPAVRPGRRCRTRSRRRSRRRAGSPAGRTGTPRQSRTRTGRATLRTRPCTRSAVPAHRPRRRTGHTGDSRPASDTTNDVAVMAVESRPRTVASSDLVGKSRDAAIRNGNETEKIRMRSSTYAIATRRIRGDADDRVEPGPQVARRRGAAEPVCRRSHPRTREPRKQPGRQHEEHRLDDDQRLDADDRGDRTGRERAEEAPDDRRAGQEREQPLCLACVERRRR